MPYHVMGLSCKCVGCFSRQAFCYNINNDIMNKSFKEKKISLFWPGVASE